MGHDACGGGDDTLNIIFIPFILCAIVLGDIII